MHGGGDGAPGGDLGGVPDAWDVVVAGGGGGDECRFGYEEGAGDGGALGVVFLGDGEGDVRVGGAESG